MIDCVPNRFGGIHSLTHESREHKRRYERYEKSKKQVELDGDNEARSSKQGSSGRQASIGAGFDRVNFKIFMTSIYSRLRLKRELPSIQFQTFTRRRKW
jgi:hypothetical protein